MADILQTIAISQLPTSNPGELANADVYPLVSFDLGGAVTKKVTYETLYKDISAKITPDLSGLVTKTSYAANQAYLGTLTGNWERTWTTVRANSGTWNSGGGGGGGLTLFLQSRSAAGANTIAWPAIGFSPVDSSSNADFVLSAKGYGAILANTPDNTATGGAKRGEYATDLQKSRVLSTQVAASSGSTIAGGAANQISGVFGTIVGGVGNKAIAPLATVVGGGNNTAGSNAVGDGWNFIGGGFNNAAGGGGPYNVVCGGLSNSTVGRYGFTGAGNENNNTSYGGVIVGGLYNNHTANGAISFIGAGESNKCERASNFIGAGTNNRNDGNYAFIGAGRYNITNGDYTFIGAGSALSAAGAYSVMGGGISNRIARPNNMCTILNGVCSTIEPSTEGYNTIVSGLCNRILGDGNTIVFGVSNTITSGNYGAIVTGNSNSVFNSYGLIGGGSLNRAGNTASVINGISNQAQGTESIIGGGQLNATSSGGYRGFIGTGYQNTISSNYGAIVNGFQNTVSGNYGAIVNGFQNTVSGNYDIIVTGYQNVVSGDYSSVITGSGLSALAPYSMVLGGLSSRVISDYGVIVGGNNNSIGLSSSYAFIGNGLANRIAVNAVDYNNSPILSYSVLVGGLSNFNGGKSGFIGGGILNSISAANSTSDTSYSVVVGGYKNRSGNYYNTIVGGGNNIAWGDSNTIVGGYDNVTGSIGTVNSYGFGNSIVGGANNRIYGKYSFIGGGVSNTLSEGCNRGVIGGGEDNKNITFGGVTNSANYMTIAGGYGNRLVGDSSIICGGEYNQIYADRSGALGSYNYVGVPDVTWMYNNGSSYAIGLSNRVPGNYNISVGHYSGHHGLLANRAITLGTLASAFNYGELTRSTGSYNNFNSTTGRVSADHGYSYFQLRGTTLGSVSSVLYQDGWIQTDGTTRGSSMIYQPPNSTFGFTATILGVSSHNDSSLGYFNTVRGIAKWNSSGACSVVTLTGMQNGTVGGVAIRNPSLNATVSANGTHLVVYAGSNSASTPAVLWSANIEGQIIRF